MDTLSDVLKVMRLQGGVFLHASFSSPWCLSVKVLPETCAPYLGDNAHIIAYHYVLEGRFQIAVEGSEPFDLRAGESVIFPRNDRHIIGSDISLPAVLSKHVVQPPRAGELASIVLNGGGEHSHMICGFLGCEKVPGNPILHALPAVLHLDCGDVIVAAWIRETFTYAADEIAASRLGSKTVIAKVSEMLFVEAIRRYVESLPVAHSGWLGGLRDTWVSRGLSLLHAQPDFPWTVESLCDRIGLSRLAFCDRFTRIVGIPPMRYLTEWPYT